ncbi:MAG: DMT family transporter [Lachnospiraceae bacterium]|nr:DMT family transporter [Lachnospiraceae bacterium]
MFGMIIAVLSGALMSIQGVFNTEVSKTSGQWVTNTFVQFTGFLLCLGIWFFYEKGNHRFLDLLQVDRKYMLLGGVLGAFITLTVILAMSAMGPGKAALFIVTSQILVAYLIELFGLFGIEKSPFLWRKIIGAAIAVAGILVFQWE